MRRRLSKQPLTRRERSLRRQLAVNTRRLREEKGYTLEAAAERAEMNWRHWQKAEAGTVNLTLHSLSRIAEALGVTVSALLAGEV